MKLTTIATSFLILMPLPLAADWIHAATGTYCSDEARTRIAAATRRQIESSVRRSEASIQPPAPIGDLSCLDGLMELKLDLFAPTGVLGSIFSGTLDGTLGSGADARRICKFADRQWRELTRPLTMPLTILKRGLPADPAAAVNPARPAGRPAGRRNDPVDEIWRSLYGDHGSE
ncbi:MAG: hypothetical protein OXF74_07205 [Rhodobacteraceae bacterium]|nr:hypothetical protein [Paracoccaceae bacterium]